MTEKQKRKRKGERPDGLIQVSIQIGYKPDGRPDRKYFYGHSRAEAERKRDEYRASFLSGAKFSKDITVAEWVTVFKQTYRTRVNRAYLKMDDVPYDRLVKKLGRLRVADVTEVDLQNALNELAGMSYSTVDKYRQAMKRVFERARKNKIITENPADSLILPQFEKGSHRALEKWEVEHILANWNTPASHAGIWVLLMMLCGLRRGEMMALRWENINLTARTLTVCEVAVIQSNRTTIERRAKTDAGLRTIPICQALYAALLSLPETERTGLVCLSAKRKPLTESAVSRGLETFCKVMERLLNGEPPTQRGRRTDIERKQAAQKKPDRKKFSFTAHDLRHTYATALYDAGVPVKAAQYFLGHADIRVTLDLYTHLSKEREAASRNKMVEYLDSWIDKRAMASLPFSIEGEKEL